MKTDTREIRVLKPMDNDEYEFVLEDLELAFPKRLLRRITHQWNVGADVFSIAAGVNRDPDEIFLALFHQARKGKTTRKFKGLYK